MKLAHSITYSATPAEVFDVLRDPDYVEAACWATGATEAGVTVEDDGDGVAIRTVRSLPAEVPSFAKSFVGDSIEVDQTTTWGAPEDDGSRDGTVEASFGGTPMRVHGTLRLRPEGSGSVVEMTGEVKAGVPLIGGKLESFAGAEIVKGLDREAAEANARLG